MSKILTDNKYYSQIADVIREQNGTSNTYTPSQMVSALKDLFYEEVEGVPPITFQGIGENLLDYRIAGASGGVGERTKNLLNNTLNTQTKNGVTFTVNDDKSVTCNGKNQNENQGLFITIGDYSATNDVILTGGVSGGNLSSYVLRAYTLTDNPVVYYDYDDGVTLLAGNDYRVQIRIAGGYTCNNLTFYPMIRLASIQDDTYEPYGYKVPVVVNGKNLLQNNATSITLNGVTCTVNDDKSVTFTGSPERSFDLIFNNSLILNPGTYIYTNGLTQSYSRIRVDMYVAGTGGNINYWANPSVTFTTTNTYKFVSRIFIQGNAGELAGLTIYPMVRESSITDDTYEPYHEPTTTNIYLDEPIEANESISLSDTNVNIPTIRGTNVLTVDTTVQPSNVYVKARKESQYETIMRERYEEAQAQLDALN